MVLGFDHLRQYLVARAHTLFLYSLLHWGVLCVSRCVGIRAPGTKCTTLVSIVIAGLKSEDGAPRCRGGLKVARDLLLGPTTCYAAGLQAWVRKGTSWRRGGERAGPGPSPLGNLNCGPARPALSAPSVRLATLESKSQQGEALRDSRQHIVIGRLAGHSSGSSLLGSQQEWRVAEAPPRPRPLPGPR